MKNNPPMLRALYIILVPMVLLIILLNSGWLQRYVPAVSVNGEKVSVVRYNYYYYDYQTTFHRVHEDELAQMGYDPGKDAAKQTYNSSMTWKEFFQQEAETDLAETAYYCDLAEQAGYVFSDEELAPVAERVAQNAEDAAASGIKMKNYYIAYYGPGMTEEIYIEELTRVVKAQAYKKYLEENYRAEEQELTAWLEENPGEDYLAVQLQLIVMTAVPDRFTGEVGEAQLDALQSKLDALVARYEGGTSFEVLQQAFSVQKEGTVLLTKATDLPAAFADHYIINSEGADERLAFVDETTGTAYFAVRTGFGGSGREAAAHAVLGGIAVENMQAEQLPAYTPQHKTFGMLLTAS